MLALRRAVVLAAVCGAVLAVGACSPAASRPTPSPTTPVALTDAEAFAAAEETYRAYVDALNSVDLADPATFEPVFALTTGDALDGEKRSLTTMHANGWVKAGDASISAFIAQARDAEMVTAIVCYDVSRVMISDNQGNPQTAADRQVRYALRVVFDAGAADSVTISSSEAVEDTSCA